MAARRRRRDELGARLSEAPPERPYRVAVCGGGSVGRDDRAAAGELGALLARAGAVVICGGYGGVMEAVAEGAAREGGLSVGILSGPDERGASPWITLPLATGMGEARNALVVRGAEAVVTVGGQWGTLSEIALARKMGVPVATVGTPPAEGLGLPAFAGAAEAAEWALEQARARRAAARAAAPDPA